MAKIMILGLTLLVLATYGCEPSEESKSTKNTTETTTEKIAGEVKETAQVIAEKAEEIERQAEPVVEEAVEESKEMVASVVEKTKETASQSVEVTKDVMNDAKEVPTETANEVVDATKQAISPETIVLEASYGNITFPHAQHSDSMECGTCHGDSAPGPFDLDKNKAHDLCKGCHKLKGLGPTDCKGCHKK